MFINIENVSPAICKEFVQRISRKALCGFSSVTRGYLCLSVTCCRFVVVYHEYSGLWQVPRLMHQAHHSTTREVKINVNFNVSFLLLVVTGSNWWKTGSPLWVCFTWKDILKHQQGKQPPLNKLKIWDSKFHNFFVVAINIVFFVVFFARAKDLFFCLAQMFFICKHMS